MIILTYTRTRSELITVSCNKQAKRHALFTNNGKFSIRVNRPAGMKLCSPVGLSTNAVSLTAIETSLKRCRMCDLQISRTKAMFGSSFIPVFGRVFMQKNISWCLRSEW